VLQSRLWKASSIACLLALLAACASAPEGPEGGDAATLYAKAQVSVRNANWEIAVRDLRRVQARFPFDPYATQAHLDLIYVQFQIGDKELVIEEADRFIRENPRHAAVDYAYYMRGIAYFPPDQWFLERWFDIDRAATDPADARRSFQYFRRLVEAFPNSSFAADSRARMVTLYQQLARHELLVARWYMRRGAYVAAVARAKEILAAFPESEARAEALEVMVAGYRRLGLDDLAADAQRVLDLNYPGREPTLRIQPRNERWIDWIRDFFT
jgi:outer membrane protein assembly factor BamD